MRSPAPGRRARASRFASIPTSTPAAIPTFRPASRPTSSASRSTRHATSCRRMQDRAGLEIVGLHTHVGSQIMDLEPLRRAAAAVVALARDLRRRRAGDRASRSRRRPRHLLRRHGRADGGGIRRGHPARRPRLGLAIVLEPGPQHRRAGGRAPDARRRRQGAAGRQAVRDSRRRDDRADAADALQRLPPHRAGRAARRAGGARRMSSGRSARAATRSARTGGFRGRRSAISSPCSTPAPTAPSWRRTTIAARCRRKYGAGRPDDASSAGARRSTICWRSKSDHGARNHAPDRLAHRVRGPRSERQADAGRVAARLPDGAGPRLPDAVVSRLRDVDRQRDLQGAARRARLSARRPAAALRRQSRREAGRRSSRGSLPASS